MFGNSPFATRWKWPAWPSDSAANFEARGFLTVAISDDPNRHDLRHDLARLSQHPAAVARRGQTVTEVLARKPDKKVNGEVRTFSLINPHGA